ncbi:GNAT family N-acetyltransferase [Flavobacterium sp. GCM10023249]|uniref:GNAT family N-acetyltransferase n=1 Tax=unclassified Flavobacterium TaxID=196869 RepID=UPI00362367F4
MQLIEATKEQLAIVRDLAYAIWPATYGEILSKEQLEYMLDNFYAISSLEEQINNGHVFLLIQDEGVNLGFAAYEVNCKDSGKTKLHKIYVLPQTQGKGLGKLLLTEVENRAKAAQNTHLFLNVNKYNNAQEFYKAKGFIIAYEEVIDIGQGYVMDDYVMEKPLN